MLLKVAGGVGEHGRNCFYVESKTLHFLVDCGLMAENPADPNPHLSYTCLLYTSPSPRDS